MQEMYQGFEEEGEEADMRHGKAARVEIKDGIMILKSPMVYFCSIAGFYCGLVRNPKEECLDCPRKVKEP